MKCTICGVDYIPEPGLAIVHTYAPSEPRCPNCDIHAHVEAYNLVTNKLTPKESGEARGRWHDLLGRVCSFRALKQALLIALVTWPLITWLIPWRWAELTAFPGVLVLLIVIVELDRRRRIKEMSEASSTLNDSRSES